MIEESRIETVGQIVCAGDDTDTDGTDTVKGHFYDDERLPLSFHRKRHITTISGDTAISKSWRIRDRVSRELPCAPANLTFMVRYFISDENG